jgi:replication factor C small subunit
MKQLWVEKYRPRNVGDYVWRDEGQRRQVLSWIKEKWKIRILLSGSPGIGKTTMSKMLMTEIGIEDADVMEVNASRETSIDFIRDKIVPFISTIAWGPFKVVILDEADRLSPNAQDSLKGIIEEYSSFARFILTCNTPNKVVPALHSRCQQFHFTKLDMTEYTARAATILVNEDVDFNLETLDLYVSAAYPDLRKCINLLQQNVSEGKLHLPAKEDSGNMDWRYDMIELFKTGKIQEARKLLCGKLRLDEIEEVYRWLYDNISVFGDSAKQDSAVLIIKQGLADHTLVADAEINLAAVMIKLARL